MKKTLIFQLGSNNWQREGEFAPGSGILHESHHQVYNQTPNTCCYSVYPSQHQTSNDPKVSIFKLEHEIPICESLSPVSSYRFHSMSETDFQIYRDKLIAHVESAINHAEQEEGMPITMAVAHHTFLNPLILSMVNERREQHGRPRFKLICFVHGTALKMYMHERAGIDPEYPMRFLPMMEQKKIFSDTTHIDACVAISNEQVDKFSGVFPHYPSDRIILSPNGYNPEKFKPNPSGYQNREHILQQTPLADSPIAHAPRTIDTSDGVDNVVVFCGKFADWKRLDHVLAAAAEYEKHTRTITLVIGSGPDDAIQHYHSLAYDKLQLKHTYFLGAQPQNDIAKFNAMADLGVYPSRNEPFGLVLIESMACGTPVIAVNSGGPKDFVTQDVGGLVPECEGEALTRALIDMINTALSTDWKQTKGPHAAQYAFDTFSVDRQCHRLLEDITALEKPLLEKAV